MKGQCLDCVQSMARALCISLLTAVAMALVWDIVDWMRNYGSGQAVLPQLTPTQLRDVLGESPSPAWTAGAFIDWYNTTFVGAARFGTALGIVMGGFYALGSMTENRFVPKILAAIVVGALIGGRLALLISSSAHLFVWGMILGAIFLAGAVGFLATRPQLPDLPL